MPISYTVIPIDRLLTSENLPSVRNIEDIQRNMQKAMKTFDDKQLASRQILSSKVDEPTHKNLASPIHEDDDGSCKLCDSCGGDFPVLSGHGISKSDTIETSWMTFGAECKADYTLSNGQPQLCCKESAKAK